MENLPKPWYLSKTILVNIVMGLALIVAQFSPAIADVIKTYFNEIGSGWVLINIALRFITKQEIG